MALTIGCISLGCNKNRVDTETALGLLTEKGYRLTDDPTEADIILVNTCGFIDSAKEESINTILDMAEYKTSGRCKLLIATGCLTQRYADELKNEIPEIDLIFGVNQYAKLPEAIENVLNGKTHKTFCSDDHSYFEHSRVLTTPFYSAYIRIGEGCSNRCTFCAIPLIRGPYRSRSEEDILKESACLASRGVREHILVAQDTTRYGTDYQAHSALPELMKKISEINGIDWLRTLYCYPDETDERLLDLLASGGPFCPYLDLPVQHINDSILKRMNRRGTSADILRSVGLAKERGLTLRTSIIVGFPGETEEQFNELLDFVRETRFDCLGAFTYSAEEGTPASRLPDQIPDEVKQDRLDRLMTLQSAISLENNRKQIGSTAKVLVTDKDNAGNYLGRTSRQVPETDGETYFTGNTHYEIGSFAEVVITDAKSYDLYGEAK